MVLYATRSVVAFVVPLQEVSILCFHSISDAPQETSIPPGQFTRYLEALRAHGFAFVRLSDILAWHKGGNDIPRRAVAITFDDGYADVETAALPILKRFKAPATLFVAGDGDTARTRLGNSIPLLDATALARLRTEDLVTIGYHGATHADVRALFGEALAHEVTPPFPARTFAYAGGNYSPEAVAAVRASGYEAAVSIKSTLVSRSSDLFLLPRSVITRDMASWEVVMRASRAASWYRALTHLI